MKEKLYKLSKNELTEELRSVGLDTEGSLDDLRRRLKRFIDKHPDAYTKATTSNENAHVETVARRPEIEMAEQRPTEEATITTAKIMNQMRKWGIHFDGKDPWAFIERLDELRTEYDLTDEQWLRGLPELLRGDALLWCRNTRENWYNWREFLNEFKDTFLPRRYRTQLANEIRDRIQKEGETYIKYATHMLTLMRRAGGYSAEEQVEQLYENLHPTYQNRIWREEIRSPRDLQQKAYELERLQALQQKRRPKQNDNREPTVAAAYNKTECCWRCKQRGHTRFDCQRPAKKFCSQCGKDGILTRDCHPFPGNEGGAGEPSADSRSTK